MKFNKNGEKLQAQKKHNFRFDEEGHIIVQDPLYNVLPTVTVAIESKDYLLKVKSKKEKI